MAYDFHGGSWEEFTAHNAPLMGNTAGLPDTEMFNLVSLIKYIYIYTFFYNIIVMN